MNTALEDRTGLFSKAPDVDGPSSRGISGATRRQGLEENRLLAQLFDETAALLEAQGANRFRVKAYRSGAEEIRNLGVPVRELFDAEGREGLVRLPHIGVSLSRAIATWLETGVLGILRRLRGEEAEERDLMTVPGLGRELAHRIHHDLQVTTLEELEEAAHDGRLASLPGFGRRRAQAVRDQLEARLRRRGPRRSRPSEATGDRPAEASSASPLPGVADLLSVDRKYRELAQQDLLPKIRPRRFNPDGEAWLPILHTTRGSIHYTALFSNTARAHQLGRTRDWVVIYVEDHAEDGQWTVVTERHGALAGRRVVRGREPECLAFYEAR